MHHGCLQRSSLTNIRLTMWHMTLFRKFNLLKTAFGLFLSIMVLFVLLGNSHWKDYSGNYFSLEESFIMCSYMVKVGLTYNIFPIRYGKNISHAWIYIVLWKKISLMVLLYAICWNWGLFLARLSFLGKQWFNDMPYGLVSCFFYSIFFLEFFSLSWHFHE